MALTRTRVRVEGAAESVERFLEALAAEAPPLAVIGRVTATPLAGAAARLRDGAVVAVKGLGGYHLAADAASEPAVAGLLASGGLVMLLGSGPTLLAVGLAAELHGTRWVAGSALASP
jgi:hydrogenase maturation factor HypF (carbamoyltransferase family)